MSEQPLIIAGPCMAESFDLLSETSHFLQETCDRLGFKLLFKASFDKANRTSMDSPRGPGLNKFCQWASDLKSKNNLPMLTDIHEPSQAESLAEVMDCLQIPAFLCRQTDLLVASAKSGCMINIKKGQFVAPQAMQYAVEKVRQHQPDKKSAIAVTERGFAFGYGDLIVDMRSLKTMAGFAQQVIMDITHCVQIPPGQSNTSSGRREFTPLLTRSAIATGYVTGLFLEVHPDPNMALSDKDSQLNFKQATILLEQAARSFEYAKDIANFDSQF